MADLKELKKYQQYAERIKDQDDFYLGYLRGINLLIVEQSGEDKEEALREDRYGMEVHQSVEYADGRHLGYAGQALPGYSAYALNSNAAKAEKVRDSRLSGRVSSEDLAVWKQKAESEGVTLTDLIIREMNDYCARSA